MARYVPWSTSLPSLPKMPKTPSMQDKKRSHGPKHLHSHGPTKSAKHVNWATLCPRWNMSDFIVDRHLIDGTSAQLFLATHVSSGVRYALKRFDRSHKSMDLLAHEVRVHSRLHHPHVLQLHGYIETEQHICLVLEYAERGDIFDLFLAVGDKQQHHNNNNHRRRNESPVPLHKVRKYIGQLASALQHCHEMGVIHCDIKPENILLDAHDNVKLADFGLAIDARTTREIDFVAGTFEFLAPELLDLYLASERDGLHVKLPASFAFDAFSLGILLYELLTSHTPFFKHRGGDDVVQDPKNVSQAYWTMRRGYIRRRKALLRKDRDALDLICKLLEFRPDKRPTMRQVLEHRFLLSSSRSSEQKGEAPRSTDDRDGRGGGSGGEGSVAMTMAQKQSTLTSELLKNKKMMKDVMGLLRYTIDVFTRNTDFL